MQAVCQTLHLQGCMQGGSCTCTDGHGCNLPHARLTCGTLPPASCCRGSGALLRPNPATPAPDLPQTCQRTSASAQRALPPPSVVAWGSLWPLHSGRCVNCGPTRCPCRRGPSQMSCWRINSSSSPPESAVVRLVLDARPSDGPRSGSRCRSRVLLYCCVSSTSSDEAEALTRLRLVVPSVGVEDMDVRRAPEPSTAPGRPPPRPHAPPRSSSDARTLQHPTFYSNLSAFYSNLRYGGHGARCPSTLPRLRPPPGAHEPQRG